MEGAVNMIPVVGSISRSRRSLEGLFFGPFPLCRMPLDVIKLIFDLRCSNGEHVIVYRPSAVHSPTAASSGLNAPNH